MDSAAIIARLKDQVPALRRVGMAMDLAAVLEGKLPDQTGPSAFVVATAERGDGAQLGAGAYSQNVTETVAVILTFRAIDTRTGDRIADEVETVKKAVREAIAGWAPEGAFDLYALSRGSVIAFRPGTLAWAYEFTASDQLRIA